EPLAEVDVVELPLEVTAERDQRGQRVLDLVGEAGRERAERGQPIRAAQVALEPPDQREISQHADDAEVLALAALERRRAELDRHRAAVPPAERQVDAGDRRAA